MQHKMKRYTWVGEFNDMAPEEEAQGWHVVTMSSYDNLLFVVWARETPQVRTHEDVVMEKAKRRCPACFEAEQCLGDSSQTIRECHNLPDSEKPTTS